MDVNDSRRHLMEQFLQDKQRLGELAFEDIDKVCELGAGNGGVVWKVTHRTSKVTMAQKVRPQNEILNDPRFCIEREREI